MQACGLLLYWELSLGTWSEDFNYLFIYLSSRLCCPLRFPDSPQTCQWECFLVFGNLSFLSLPSQDGSPSLSLLPLFLSFMFCPTSFRRQWAAFLSASCPLPAFSSCLVEFAQRSNVLSMNLWGEKLVSLSYSSAILGQPPVNFSSFFSLPDSHRGNFCIPISRFSIAFLGLLQFVVKIVW